MSGAPLTKSNGFQPSTTPRLASFPAIISAFLNEVVRRAETRASFWRVERQ